MNTGDDKVFINDPGAYPPGSYGAEMVRLQQEVDLIRAKSAAADIACRLSEAIEEIKEIFLEFCRKIVDVLTPYLKKVMRWVRDAWRECLKAHAKAAGMEKCYHLAFFARKRRTRKKNLKRLLKSMEDEE